MSNKIEGVPEGWKINRVGSAKDDDYIPWFDYEQDKIVAKKYSDVFDLVNRPACCIIEPDIKIIDMSKCNVDIQKAKEGEAWEVGECHYQEHVESMGFDTRVRQNHYFGWQGGECPLPDGLAVKVFYRGYGVDAMPFKENIVSCEYHGDHSEEDYQWIHSREKRHLDIIGFIVKGSSEGYAYKHEIEGGEG